MEAQLNSGLKQLALTLDVAARQKILEYLQLLTKWNKTYNLTAIRDPHEMLVRHIFDSLAVAFFIRGPNVLDFGSGAGIPGIPLAIAFPEFKFCLLDSNRKKTTFLQHVALTLPLPNVQIVHARVEDFHFAPGFATIITRATLTISEVIAKTKHLCAKDGQLVLMKGKYPVQELAAITQPFTVTPIHVPDLNAERHAVIVTMT
jgi:16S rRNA (guanine527-N7)-methyltransferase